MYKFALTAIFLALISLSPLTAEESRVQATLVEPTVNLDFGLGDPAPATACQDPSSTTTLCIGDQMCHGQNFWAFPNGTTGEECTGGLELMTLDSVPQACIAASAMSEPTICNSVCTEVDMREDDSKTSKCCTYKKTRICDPD